MRRGNVESQHAGDAGNLLHPNSTGSHSGRIAAEGTRQGDTVDTTGSRVVGVRHTDNPGLQGLGGSLREESGYCTDRGQALPASDAWSDYTIQYYRDGKYRRVGRGVQPLAHGLPRSVGYLQPWMERMGDMAGISKEPFQLLAAKRNRVGRLKGYGNAIVPAVAAVFIRAFLESAGITFNPDVINMGFCK